MNTVLAALERRQFFKLICGGSFTDEIRLRQLISVYAQAGVHAIDISASLPIVETAIDALKDLQHPPMLMVSFPLDADPHFRKIELNEPACITCGLCLPVCPTAVFTLDNNHLQVDAPACYGCGRCVPVCPTDALHLDPFQVMPDLETVLRKPEVESVEIHSTFGDPEMIQALYQDLDRLLKPKFISICFRPQLLPLAQSVAFLKAIKAQTPFPMIVQVDGEPMSGSDDPEASLPALKAAKNLAPYLPDQCYLTISGGINTFTASYLSQPEYSAIQGVGMGTYARQSVWDFLNQPEIAQPQAQQLVASFR